MAKEDNQGRVKLNPISISQLSSLIFGKGAADPEIIGQKGDPELEYLTEGNVPISEAEMKTREIRKAFKDKKDEILGGFWDSVKVVHKVHMTFIIMDQKEFLRKFKFNVLKKHKKNWKK